MLNREQAIILIKKYLKEDESIKYAISVETIMKKMAKYTHEDEELWGLTGLLFNIDYEFTRGELEKRGKISSMLLEDLLPENSINAIKSVNYMQTDCIPITTIDKALISADALTGLIFISIKSLPSKNISDLTLQTLIENFKNPEFATRINRNRIKLCMDIGVSVSDFLTLSLDSLKEISEKLSL